MATRSLIGIENNDGTITHIYCHFDGYVEGVGSELLKHYRTEERIREMLSHGDRSSLSEDVALSAYKNNSDAVPSTTWSDAGQDYVYRGRKGHWVYRDWHDDFEYRSLVSAMEMLSSELEVSDGV